MIPAKRDTPNGTLDLDRPPPGGPTATRTPSASKPDTEATVPVRDVDLHRHFAGVPKYFVADDIVMSHEFAMLSATFPDGRTTSSAPSQLSAIASMTIASPRPSTASSARNRCTAGSIERSTVTCPRWAIPGIHGVW